MTIKNTNLRKELFAKAIEAQQYFQSKKVVYMPFIIHDYPIYDNEEGKKLIRKVINGRVVESDEQVVNDIIDVVNRLKNS